jgi:hypothetical protein
MYTQHPTSPTVGDVTLARAAALARSVLVGSPPQGDVAPPAPNLSYCVPYPPPLPDPSPPLCRAPRLVPQAEGTADRTNLSRSSTRGIVVLQAGQLR